ncbi:MAG: DUF6020 family protein [Bifidobacteriaceae bacterium]|jgi:hypothetical protein|nr:DUF6020 family protein [Bifidobacteriaceae bacterium]
MTPPSPPGWRSFLTGAARSPFAWACGLTAAVASGIGLTLSRDGAVPWSAPWFYLVIVLLSLPFALLAALARRLVERPRRRPLAVWRNRPRAFFFDWAAIWLCWVPVWLAGWPGFWCYDATAAYRSVRAGAITTALPPLHTWLSTGLQALVAEWTGSNNYGIAAFIMAQSLVVAAVFAHTLRRLRAWGAPRLVRWGGLVYFALFPTIALFSVNSGRNTLFSTALLALAVCLIDALRQPGAKPARWWLIGLLALVAIALRRDAVYVFVLFTPLAVWAYRPARKALAICFVSATLAGLLLDPLVYKAILGLAEGNPVATYSVPLQQLARAYNRPGAMTAAQKAVLEEFVTPQALAIYRPQLADPVIVGTDVRRIEADTKRFFALWAQVGAQSPGIYLDAYAAATIQGWAPGAVIDAYASSGDQTSLNPSSGTSYFCFTAEEPATVSPKGPAFIRNAYEAFSKRSRAAFEAPVIGWLWSPGTYLWLFGFAAALAAAWARRGRPSAFLPVALLALASCAPIFLGPAILVRYFLQLFYCAPLVAAFFIDPRVYAPSAPSAPRAPRAPKAASADTAAPSPELPGRPG